MCLIDCPDGWDTLCPTILLPSYKSRWLLTASHPWTFLRLSFHLEAFRKIHGYQHLFVLFSFRLVRFWIAESFDKTRLIALVIRKDCERSTVFLRLLNTFASFLLIFIAFNLQTIIYQSTFIPFSFTAENSTKCGDISSLPSLLFTFAATWLQVRSFTITCSNIDTASVQDSMAQPSRLRLRNTSKSSTFFASAPTQCFVGIQSCGVRIYCKADIYINPIEYSKALVTSLAHVRPPIGSLVGRVLNPIAMCLRTLYKATSRLTKLMIGGQTVKIFPFTRWLNWEIDWPPDSKHAVELAKASGIDAFAINIGRDTTNEKQLPLAYDIADR